MSCCHRPLITQECSVLYRSRRDQRWVQSLAKRGGLLIDHGWLRVLGSGHAQLPRNLSDWNDGRAEGYLLVADDAAGGFFSINGRGGDVLLGARYVAVGAVEHWLTDFLCWALSDRLNAFYKGLRWDGWRKELSGLGADQCFSFYPFLWAREGSIEGGRRTMVDVIEQFEMNVDLAHKLDYGSEQPETG